MDRIDAATNARLPDWEPQTDEPDTRAALPTGPAAEQAPARVLTDAGNQNALLERIRRAWLRLAHVVGLGSVGSDFGARLLERVATFP